MIKRSILFTLLAIAMATTGVVAQNNTNSPYTRFGYGKLVDASFGRTGAMGGIGIGFRSKSTINPANPAAYSEIDSTSFLFEVGFSGLLTNFSSNQGRYRAFTANIDYFAMQFPVTRWMGMSVGLIPYSFSGYNFGTKDSLYIPSNNDSVLTKNSQIFSGTGGISQVYLGMSFELFKRLSLGVNGYYMFGSVNDNRALYTTFSDNRNAYQIYSTSNLKVNGLNLRLGLQYYQPLRQNKDRLIIGAVYEFQHRLGSTYTITTQGVDTVIDTLSNAFQLPNTYGLGFSYNIENRWNIGLDAQFQQFSKSKFNNKTDVFSDRIRLAAGLEFVNRPQGQKYIDRMMWRFGGSFSQSYAKVNNHKINEYSITMGFGFPFRFIKSMLNVNFEYGGLGTRRNNLIKEDYFKMAINFTINETWFVKPKIK